MKFLDYWLARTKYIVYSMNNERGKPGAYKVIHPSAAVYSNSREGTETTADELAVRYRRGSSAAARVRRRIHEAVVLTRRRGSAEQVARGRVAGGGGGGGNKALLLRGRGRGHQGVDAKHRRGRRPRSMRRESAGRAHADRENQRQAAAGARRCCRREQQPRRRRTHGRTMASCVTDYTGGSIVI